MHCQECGAEVAAESVYCPQCGSRLGDDNMHVDEISPQDRFRNAAANQQADSGNDEESELWTGRYSGKAMIGTWIGAAVLTLAGVISGAIFKITQQGWGILIGVIVLVWIILGLYYLYQRYSVHYTVTNHRLIHERGILWRVVDRIELIDVGDITFRQGPIERMLNVGTVQITSSDPTDPNLALPGIEDVRVVAGIIDSQRREERKRRGLHIHSI